MVSIRSSVNDSLLTALAPAIDAASAASHAAPAPSPSVPVRWIPCASHDLSHVVARVSAAGMAAWTAVDQATAASRHRKDRGRTVRAAGETELRTSLARSCWWVVIWPD